jgi:hypothetical protein
MKQLYRVSLAELIDDIIVEESLETSQNGYVRVYRITLLLKGTVCVFYSCSSFQIFGFSIIIYLFT